RRQLERLGSGERLRGLLSRAGREKRGADLLEHVEGRRRSWAVRPEPDAETGSAQARQRRDPAAKRGVRPRAVDDRNVMLREQRDLLGVELDAVRRDELWREDAVAGQRENPALADRRRKLGGERFPGPAPVLEPAELVGALVEMRRNRQAELE